MLMSSSPLLTGTEEVLGSNKTKYIRESRRSADMHFSLLTQMIHQTRVLRGHTLKSLHAPAAGIRYDGL